MKRRWDALIEWLDLLTWDAEWRRPVRLPNAEDPIREGNLWYGHPEEPWLP